MFKKILVFCTLALVVVGAFALNVDSVQAFDFSIETVITGPAAHDGDPFMVTITFEIPIQYGSGFGEFDESDIQVTGGVVVPGSFAPTADAAVYTAIVAPNWGVTHPATAADVEVFIPAGAGREISAPPGEYDWNEASNTLDVDYAEVENQNITTIISGPTSHDGVDPFSIVITFGEWVDFCDLYSSPNTDDCFSVEDIDVVNGVASDLTGAANIFTAIITPDGLGTLADPLDIEISIAGGVTEAFGPYDDDDNLASNVLGVDAEIEIPDCDPNISVWLLNAPMAQYGIGDTITLTVKFSEAIDAASFELADIDVVNADKVSLTMFDPSTYTLELLVNADADVEVNIQADVVLAAGVDDCDYNLAAEPLTIPYIFIADNNWWNPEPFCEGADTPYFYDMIDLEHAGTPASAKVNGLGDYQLFFDDCSAYLDDCTEPVDSYVRVRIDAPSGVVPGDLGVKIFAINKLGVMTEVASGLSNAAGVVDIVGLIPAGSTYQIVMGTAGYYDPASEDWAEDLDVWVVQGEEPGGGVIIDFRKDNRYADDYEVQFSTTEKASWVKDPFTYIFGAQFEQFFIDLPVGTYNVGIQDTGYFGFYADAVEVKDKAFFEWTPSLLATVDVETTVNGALECQDYWNTEVLLNPVEGFLFDDLNVGDLYMSGGILHRPFRYNPGFNWDLGIALDGYDTNWYLTSLSFNYAAGDLEFDLDETGAQYVQIGRDMDWDSATLYLTPPSENLATYKFDINNGYMLPDDDDHMYEDVFVFAKSGCCGETGPFETMVRLDEDGTFPTCCEQPDPLPWCNGNPNWKYDFMLTEPSWDFVPVDLSDWCTCNPDPLNDISDCIVPNYSTIVGDGPWSTELVAAEKAELGTIVDIAVADGRFTTLVSALQTADLADTLAGDGPFTVFAPTDDAFDKIPVGTLASLFADTDALTDVLLYHVVSGTVLAEDVVLLDEAETLLGEPVEITVVDGDVFINDAQVIITDILADNGVIHVIDTVLTPPESTEGTQASRGAASKLEYVVDELDGAVMLERSIWTDAFGNQLVSVLAPDKCVDLCLNECCEEGGDFDFLLWTFKPVLPQYVVSKALNTEPVLEAEGWETTAWGPITEIGRYMYTASLEHGYLGQILGFESKFADETCVEQDECTTTSTEICCEIAQQESTAETKFAISPADVRMGRWSWSWVMAMYELDLTNGVDAAHYDPEGLITRGQMAAFLARFMRDNGLEDMEGVEQFSDIPESYGFYDDVLMLKAYNVSDGFEDGTFQPNAPMLRSQMAKFIEIAFRAIEMYTGDITPHWNTDLEIVPTGFTFEDVGMDHVLVGYIEEMFFDTLTDGCRIEDGDLFFCPDDVVTRESLAKFLVRAIQDDDTTRAFWNVLAPEK